MIKKRCNFYVSKKMWISWLFIAPSLSGTIVFVCIPFSDIIRRSFFSVAGNEFVWGYHYNVVWHNQAFRLALKNTVLFILIGIPLLMGTSFLTALLIQSSRRRTNLYKTTIVLPMAIPTASICLLWKIFFSERGRSTAFGVLLFTFLWKNIGYNMLLWLAGLGEISDSVYEAAKLDGAGNLAIMRYIVVPELKGTAGVVFALSVINGFRIYREAYLIAGSYPHESIYMLQHLFNHWFLDMDIQNMSTAAAIISIGAFLCLFICFLYSKIRKRGE